METPGEGALGSLDYTPEERKILAKRYKLDDKNNFVRIYF
jgi:hypothetical protein